MSRGCTCKGRSGERKTLYRSQRAAMNAALRGGRVGAVRTYRCPAASGWHITHGGPR